MTCVDLRTVDIFMAREFYFIWCTLTIVPYTQQVIFEVGNQV